MGSLLLPTAVAVAAAAPPGTRRMLNDDDGPMAALTVFSPTGQLFQVRRSSERKDECAAPTTLSSLICLHWPDPLPARSNTHSRPSRRAHVPCVLFHPHKDGKQADRHG